MKKILTYIIGIVLFMSFVWSASAWFSLYRLFSWNWLLNNADNNNNLGSASDSIISNDSNTQNNVIEWIISSTDNQKTEKKKIITTNCSKSYLIPVKTYREWTSFKTYKPNCVTLEDYSEGWTLWQWSFPYTLWN